jgi:hypothetical protein
VVIRRIREDSEHLGHLPVPRPSLSREVGSRPLQHQREEVLACWRTAWRIALGNLRRPTPGSGFVANYIDPAFNSNLFLWDSCFIAMFGRYGRRVFDVQRTLDNLYAEQHPDGFICRQIVEHDGSDAFDRFDPSATGPNLLA